jgi:hypothetical protein
LEPVAVLGRPTLINVVSSGRCGTRFFAALIRDQGYVAFHEELTGAPSTEQITSSMDNWFEKTNKEGGAPEIFEGSEILEPYISNVLSITQSNRLFSTYYQGAAGAGLVRQSKTMLSAFLKDPALLFRLKTNKIIVDCNNDLSLCVTDIANACRGNELDHKALVLFRNPIKTIHAIFQRETKNGTRSSSRPKTFHKGSGLEAAANIWKSYYEFFNVLLFQRPDNFKAIELESVVNCTDYLRNAMEYCGLGFDRLRADIFLDRIRKEPLRKSKSLSRRDQLSVRNSDLYLDVDFVFSEKDVENICSIVKEVSADYGIDLSKSTSDYFEYHRKEKYQEAFG